MPTHKQYKAISLWEPWASCVKTGAKRIETRSWYTNYRGELVICAAKKWDSNNSHLLSRWNFQGGLAPLVGQPLDFSFKSWPGINEEHLNFGKAVAIVDLVDCKKTELMTIGEIETEQTFGDFTPGRFAWIFDNIRAINPPFNVKGSQGFFNALFPLKEAELVKI